MGHATACAIWQVPVPTVSQMGESKSDRSLALADYIESEQPDQVRVTMNDTTELVLGFPSVEGDEIVSSDGLSVLIADIVKLEVVDQASTAVTTILVAAPFVALLGAGAIYLWLTLMW